MQGTIRRYFKIFIGVIGALASGTLVVLGLKSGSIPGSTRADLIAGTVCRDASQFWFMVVVWSVACAAFIWLAWSAYRD